MRTSTIAGLLITCVVFPAQATTTDVICSYAPSQSSAAKAVTAAAGGVGAGVAAIMSAAGLTAVTHSSGAYILTGSGGYISGTLGGAAAAPFLTTVSVAVAGGAITLELSCAPKNHPDAVRAVKHYSDVFLSETNGQLSEFQRRAVESVRNANDKAIDFRETAIDNARAANVKAIEYRDNAFGYFYR